MLSGLQLIEMPNQRHQNVLLRTRSRANGPLAHVYVKKMVYAVENPVWNWIWIRKNL